MLFENRVEAGQQLATALLSYNQDPNAIVLALPRGGVVLGYEIAKALHLPLDLILVRKLGVPQQEELAFGAIGTNGIQVLNDHVITALNIDPETIQRVTALEKQELTRRNQLYRAGQPFPNIQGKTIILVDDGIATGATMRAAIRVAQTRDPMHIIVAVPVASVSVFEDMAGENVDLVVLATPEPFYGIGRWYRDFPQLSDQEVIQLLQRAR